MYRPDPLGFLGESLTFPDSREEVLRNIKLIIRIRFVLSPSIFLILAVSALFGFTDSVALSKNQIVVNSVNLAVILLFNVIYTILVRKLENLKPLVLFQLMIDVIHFTLTIYKTGGVVSPFAFLYFIVIFSGSMLITGKTAYLIAGICSFLYSLMIILEKREFIMHQDFFIPLSGLEQNPSYLILSWSFAIFSFFAFAALASYLTGLIHRRERELKDANKTLNKKHETMLLLYRTSRALNSSRTVREVVDYILSELMEYLVLDRSLLYLNINNEYLHLYMVKQWQNPGKETSSTEGIKVSIPLRLDAGLTARSAILREAYNVDKPEESPYINRELALKIGLNPFALAPMVLRDTVVGVIGIDRSFKNGSITEEEFRILQVFANQAAITIKSLEDVDTEFQKEYGVNRDLTW